MSEPFLDQCENSGTVGTRFRLLGTHIFLYVPVILALHNNSWRLKTCPNPFVHIAMLVGALSLVAAPLAVPALTQASAATALTAADTDKDGTLDLNEVKAAAALEFDKLDKDKDGTLDLKEAAHHVSKKNFIAADSLTRTRP